ncbi:MAG: hypothetical protein QME41_03700 [Actinomycetota bacterium]|nr:hypothetical protein [Actinomycetota bacterium]
MGGDIALAVPTDRDSTFPAALFSRYREARRRWRWQSFQTEVVLELSAAPVAEQMEKWFSGIKYLDMCLKETVVEISTQPEANLVLI